MDTAAAVSELPFDFSVARKCSAALVEAGPGKVVRASLSDRDFGRISAIMLAVGDGKKNDNPSPPVGDVAPARVGLFSCTERASVEAVRESIGFW